VGEKGFNDCAFEEELCRIASGECLTLHRGAYGRDLSWSIQVLQLRG